MNRRPPWEYLVAALVAVLPFLRGALSGQCFYFRDLSRQFFPLHRFATEGLLRGELRYWNPFIHEGAPLPLPPLAYPVDLLHVLLRDEAGFSLLLALHVPLGAIAFVALARGMGLSRVAATGGALVYALGGFYLSTLNLYVYVQAAAWAPLVTLALVKADGDRRWLAAAAALAALAISTTGVEIVLQTFLFGLVLSLPPARVRPLVQRIAALALGCGLAAYALLTVRAQVAGSARGAGLPVDVVVSQSIHPITLFQVLVGNWHGDLADITNRWWGSNFFPLGFPYFLSLYLGAAALALAGVGALEGRGPRRRLMGLALAGIVVCLGRWVGLATLVEHAPLLRAFRFPSKAFFSVHFAVALLAALGLDRLGREEAPRAWRALAALAAGLGGGLLAARAVPILAPAAAQRFLEGFLPPSYSMPLRWEVARAILSDAAVGGWAAAGLALLAVAALTRRMPAPRAAAAVVALVAVDLLRTGAGLNPTVTPAFYRLSAEMAPVAEELRRSEGRTFSCDPESGPAYFRARRWQTEHDVWTFAVFMETLTPYFNVSFGVPTALSRDLTMLVPEHRVLAPEEVGAAAFPTLVGRLAAAGVSRVVCLEPLSHPDLHLKETVVPARIAPLAVHVYALDGALRLRAVAREVRRAASRTEAESLARAPGFQARGGVAVEGPLAEVSDATGRVLSVAEGADRLELDVEADRPTVAIVRDAFGAGWAATVDGAPATVLRADGRHRAVPIPAGRSRVVLRYHPPGLALGLGISAGSLLILAIVYRGRRG